MKRSFDIENDNDSSDGEILEHPFLNNFVLYILEKRQNLINFTVRVRSCELISKILDHLTETNLSRKFCDQIEEAMLERLNDLKLDVRLTAIQVLHRFQEMDNPLDRIIDSFKLLMEQDRFAKVRSLCVQKVLIRKDVIPILLLKIRDVDVSVRSAAFIRFSKLPGALKILERRVILKCASLELSDKTKTCIEKILLPNWMLYFHDNLHLFMRGIRLDANECDIKETNDLCEFILGTFFKLKPLDELLESVGVDPMNKLIPLEKLDWETCNYWRILVQYVRKHKYLAEEIERILPELVHFCYYIERFIENLPQAESTTDFLENQFILKQLFTITKGYDTSDPAGRRALQKLVRGVLSSVILTVDTVEVILSNLEPIISNVELRARYINELISEIISPEDTEEIAKKEFDYHQRINNLKDACSETVRRQESAIAIKDYILAGELEDTLKQINEEIASVLKEKSSQENDAPARKKDKATLIKCLDIAAGFLLSPQVTKMTSSLETLKSDIVFELMIHENEQIQSKAMRCFALFCIIDKKSAKDGIHLFSAPISAYQSGQECDSQILLVCIGAMVDLLRIYGTQLMAAPDEITDLSESQREEHERPFFGGTSLTKTIQELVDLMDDELTEVQEAAGRGLCSLILSNSIQSSSVLSRLVLKWSNPYEDSHKLKQLIGVTFQELPKLPGFHKQWENTTFITLRAILNAPDDSFDNAEEVAKFMVTLYKINLENNNELLNFAMRICSVIRSKPKTKQVVILSKLLNMFTFTEYDPIMDDLQSICDEIRDVTNNQIVSKNIIKFVAKLNQVYGQKGLPTVAEEDEESDESRR